MNDHKLALVILIPGLIFVVFLLRVIYELDKVEKKHKLVKGLPGYPSWHKHKH